MSALNKQIGGNHYKKYSIQPAWILSVLPLPFTILNAIKYMRHSEKNGVQDLEKAQHYIKIQIEIGASKTTKLISRIYVVIYRKKIKEFAAQFGDLERSFILSVIDDFFNDENFNQSLRLIELMKEKYAGGF